MGVTIAQMCAYYRNYPQDRLFMKALVGFCVLLNVAQLSTISYTCYFWLIVTRTVPNSVYLYALKESLVVLPAYLTYFLATVVQCFYAMRVWFVSGGNIWLTLSLVALSIMQLAGGYALVSYMVSKNTLLVVYSEFNHVSGGVELAASILCDLLITLSLVYYLRKSRAEVFSRTRHAIDQLVIYSVNIGLLANIAVIANLITWLAAPESDFTWAVFHFSLGKVYVNSMLVSLNARNRIRKAMYSGRYVTPTSMFDVFDGTGQAVGSDVDAFAGKANNESHIEMYGVKKV